MHKNRKSEGKSEESSMSDEKQPLLKRMLRNETDHFKHYLRQKKENTDFYQDVLESIKSDTHSWYKRNFTLPYWKYNDLSYDNYKNRIPFWRKLLEDENTKKALSLLIFYTSWDIKGFIGKGTTSRLVNEIANCANNFDTERIGLLYNKYYKPNSKRLEYGMLRKELNQELAASVS
ncbi:MAG: hypothetical protein JJ59_00120 [Candidatus Micrarchaeum sp. AZ1]|jgi:hypothetical protein|nr:MAG: hypothetical protein JJ59_00120 [Candidatus Micrarchaeum sp. AZ1]